MFTRDNKNLLLDIAQQSIRHGLDHGRPLAFAVEDIPEALSIDRATFVTLERKGRLRGCIGTLEAYQSLARDVAEHAYGAAFRDTRFSPLREYEYADLEIHISILSPAEKIEATTEEELTTALRPGVDGLILSEGQHRATFLPSVWEGLPDPLQFIRTLKKKAGWKANYWSDNLRAERYEVESIP